MFRLYSLKNETESQPNRRVNNLEKAFEYKLASEAPIRDAIKKKLWEKEAEISIWAADTYCELHPEINSPKGSLRRKKGYEDGRHIVRAMGNCIRVGSSDPLLHDILSWFAIGDPAFRVTSRDVEYFLSFVHQGSRHVLAESEKSMLDELMEDARRLCRQAGTSYQIRSNASPIAERMIELLKQTKARLIPALQGWLREEQKNEFERMTLALSEILSREPRLVCENWVKWLLENMLSHASFPEEVLRFQMSALEIAIMEIVGVDAAHRIEPLLNHVRINASHLILAGKLYRLADYAAYQATLPFVDPEAQLDGLSIVDFSREIQEAGKNLLRELAVLFATHHLRAEEPFAAQLWLDRILPRLPLSRKKLQLDFVLAILDTVKKLEHDEAMESFLMQANYFFHVMETSDQASTLLKHLDRVPDTAVGLSGISARGVYLSALLQYATGQDEHGIACFRRWLYDQVFPRLSLEESNSLLTQWSDSQTALNDSESAKIFMPFIDAARETLKVWKERSAVLSKAREVIDHAVAMCYEVVPDHPARPNGQKMNGKRDGLFLIEEVLRSLAIGKLAGKPRLMQWYREEIAWTATLPAMALDAFIEGLIQGLASYPFVAELLKEVKASSSSFTAARKIYQHSTEVAQSASDVVIEKMPEFNNKIGTQGREAFYRDNAMTLRAIAYSLVNYPQSSDYFTLWFEQTISPYIRVRNNDVIRMNLQELSRSLQSNLDKEELKVLNRILVVMGGLLQVKISTAPKKLVKV